MIRVVVIIKWGGGNEMLWVECLNGGWVCSEIIIIMGFNLWGFVVEDSKEEMYWLGEGGIFEGKR